MIEKLYTRRPADSGIFSASQFGKNSKKQKFERKKYLKHVQNHNKTKLFDFSIFFQ